MANANISTLIGRISTVTPDATAINTYQDELFFELSRISMPKVLVQTGASFIQATKDVPLYTLPAADGARTLLMLFYDETQLAQASYDETHFFSPAWRNVSARPVAFLQDTINRVQFGSVPPPDHDGVVVAGNPVTFAAWPTDNYTVIYAKTDTAYAGTNLSDTFLAVAFEVLARELGRDSDHMDPDAAIAAKQMADLFWRLSFPEGV